MSRKYTCIHACGAIPSTALRIYLFTQNSALVVKTAGASK